MRASEAEMDLLEEDGPSVEASLELSEPLARHRMRGGLIGSLALHVAFLLLIIFRLPDLIASPPPVDLPIPVNLVRLGAATTAPLSSKRADLPQERAPQILERKPVIAGVAPLAPQSSLDQPHGSAVQQVPTRQAASVSNVQPHPKGDVKLASRPHPSAPDALSLRLQQLAKLTQPSAPLQTDQQSQEGAGLSNATATSKDAGRGLTATYSTKDFIRSQIIRHWNLKVGAADAGGWTVSIHLKLRPDGSVGLAEIVDLARYRLSRPYFEFALSARNAAYLASPLTIPVGQYALVKDIVVDFNARQVLQ